MRKPTKLKPCAGCGTDRAEIVTKHWVGLSWVQCPCGMEKRRYMHKRTAAAVWNRRVD